MEPLIRIDLDQVLSGGEPVVLELGCGKKKRADAIGIDRIDLPEVDIVADVEEGLDFLPDGCADEIYARSFFEHIQNFEKLMSEIVRVLKKGAGCLFLSRIFQILTIIPTLRIRGFSGFTASTILSIPGIN